MADADVVRQCLRRIRTRKPGGVVQRQIARGSVRQTADRFVAHGADGSAAAQSLEHLASVISRRPMSQPSAAWSLDQSGRWLRYYQRLMNQGRIYRDPHGGTSSACWQRDQDADAADPARSNSNRHGKSSTAAKLKAARYYTTRAIVYNAPDGAKSPGPNPVTLELKSRTAHPFTRRRRRAASSGPPSSRSTNDTVFIDPLKE